MTNLLDRDTATEYASWFRALADPSRVQIVEFVARAGRPLPVGEIVEAMGLAQSTVSQHLKILADVRFVLIESMATRATTASTPRASRASRPPPTWSWANPLRRP